MQMLAKVLQRAKMLINVTLITFHITYNILQNISNAMRAKENSRTGLESTSNVMGMQKTISKHIKLWCVICSSRRLDLVSLL